MELQESIAAALSDGIIRVRPYTLSDVDAAYEAAAESVDDIYPWMEWCHPGLARSETLEFVSRQDYEPEGDWPMLIEDAVTGDFYGSAGFNFVHPIHRSANLGYWIRSSAAGRGYAARGSRLSAIVGLRDRQLSRMEVVVAVDNERSMRVAEKIGAFREGMARDRLFLHGEARDAVVYSLTQSDLPALIREAGV